MPCCDNFNKPSTTARWKSAAFGGIALLMGNAAYAQTPDTEAPPAQSEQPAPAPTPPAQNMTMEQVERLLGPPRDRIGPVGRPPITRWVYDAYTVYFEKRRVIHTVDNRK